MTATAEPSVEVLVHHLGLMGWPLRAEAPAGGLPLFVAQPGAASVPAVRRALAHGRAVVALSPHAAFCADLAVVSEASRCAAPLRLHERGAPGALRRMVSGLRRSPGSLRRPRSLHAARVFRSAHGEGVLWDERGDAVWWWLPAAGAGILLLGTDLAGDLVRYRQGDPAQAEGDGPRERWGLAGERPNYLFEPQRLGEPAHARHADAWAWLLARVLAERTGAKLDPVLPGGAPGAVVLTGDDDQAALDCYREQLAALGDAPITYFLHPQTRHTQETLRTILGRPGIELGLHPDALDAPERYDARLHEQVEWFSGLRGHPPRSVRNHGFLNRGYWGHLGAWLAEGLTVSSNLPGFDGSVLNGSLLPARVVHGGRLTAHWSMLTSVGDGVLFEKRWSERETPARVAELARNVRDSGLPGVLVFNLHPENFVRARSLHEAALALVADGFLAWGLEQCVEWFRRRDDSCAAALAAHEGPSGA